MTQAFWRRLGLLVCLLLSPVAAAAQVNASIAGVVRDTTGAVLPGVTVEASSPALIEKIRTVTTDGQGQYRLVDLRPGTYAVTFTLAGFNTARREGVELTTGFTATINGDLRVGALEETVTVTGASPVVDTTNTRTQTVLTREVIDSLPTGRTVQAFGSLTVGAVTRSTNLGQDVGGLDGEASTNIIVHNSRTGDMKLLMDGMGYNWGGGAAGGAGRSIFPNQNFIQEVVMEVTGASAEVETGGVQLNVVPKDGGNTFKGTFFTAYSGPGLQSRNLTDELRARGLTAASRVKRVYDNGGGLGGPISRDRLWFFTAHRKWGAEQYVPGNYFNATPNSLFYAADLDRQAQTWQPTRDHSVRLTWQATPRNKVTASLSYVRNCTCYNGIEALNSPEATNHSKQRGVLHQSTWTYPHTSKLLFQAGLTVGLNYRTSARIDGVTRANIPITELSTGYRYGAKVPGASITLGDYGDSTAHQNNGRFSASYITGTHAFKTGFYFHHGQLVRDQLLNDPPIAYTFRNQVPVSATFYASPHYSKEQSRTLALYAQDQWTIRKLTLNLGLRYDNHHEWVPQQVRPAGPFMPEFQISKIDNVPNWKDISPRLGAAYDVFGNGKTAVKASVGRYLEALFLQTAGANNPAQNIVTAATRTWNDANRDYVPQANELGPFSNNRFGTTRITNGWDPDLLTGWRQRTASWQGSASIVHELRPGFGVTAGYFRTWYSNLRVTDNVLIAPANFDPFCVTAPTDARLPGGGGNQVCGLYDIKQSSFGQVSTLVRDASGFGNPTEVFNGVDIAVNARYGRGGMLGGGVSTGQTVTDNCFVVDSPDQRFCKVTLPFRGQTQIKLNGSYPLPWDLIVSGVFQNLPGTPIQANYVATNAQALPTLGRNLGGCSLTAVTCTATVALNLMEPNTEYEDRLTQVDLRLARTFRMQRTRLLASVDVYNAFNANTILAINTRYGAQWLRPTLVMTPRLVKFSAQFDF